MPVVRYLIELRELTGDPRTKRINRGALRHFRLMVPIDFGLRFCQLLA